MVFGCGGPNPSLVCIQDPFHKLLFRFRGSVQISEQDVLAALGVEGAPMYPGRRRDSISTILV